MSSPTRPDAPADGDLRSAAALVVLCTLFVGLSYWQFSGQPSPDLIATWLAGHFYSIGRFDQVYPPDTALYTMLPPSEWWPYLQELGRDHPVFPYVYPPLWAALTARITPYVGIDGFQRAAQIINPGLMAGMIVLAARAAELRHVQLVFATMIGLAICMVGLPGAVALEQNQPQILVSFLIVAAIERDRAGATRLAGAALALAAAIKLYPVLLALLWLAGRRYRSATSFALCGAALAAASLAIAGWPLHSVFLQQVATIKNTVLVTYFTYGIDPTLAQFFAFDRLQFIAGLDNPPGAAVLAGWTVLAKGAIWSAGSSLAMLALLAALAVRLRRGPPPQVFFWPGALVAIAMLSPLSWGYHYLPALAFAPVLIWTYGTRTGVVLLVAIVVPVSIAALGPLAAVPLTTLFPQVAGTLSMVLLGVALLAAPQAKPG